jgi:hypothetical protein
VVEAPKTPTEQETVAAQQHYQSGVSFFESGNYAAARAEFEAAYQLTHLPDLLYNLAQVAQKQDRSADEERYLREYLTTNPKDATEVRNRLSQLEALHPPADYGRIPPTPALGLAAGGVLSFIIGFACGGAAISAANTVADAMNNNKPFTADLLNTQEKGKQLNGAAIAFDVIGGAALAAGGAWIGYWLYQKQQAKKSAPTAPAKVALTPTGLGVLLSGSF